MRRIWGFALFFFGLGMFAMLLIGEYTDRVLYNWNLSVGRILYVLLLEEMDGSSGIEAGIQKGKPAQISDKNRDRYTAGRCVGMPGRQKKRELQCSSLRFKTKLSQLFRISNRKHIHIIF